MFRSARGLRTPGAVCHAAPRLAQPRRDDPDQASHAPPAAPPALPRAPTVCEPDAQAPLGPGGARSRPSPRAPSRPPRPPAPAPPASPPGGQTASEHCLHQCGVKPTVSDRLNSSHINGLILCTGGLMLPLRGLVTRRADIIG